MLVMMLLALFAWLLPQTAAAEQYIHEPDNYSVSLGGTNIIYFKAPVYDQKNADQWVATGYLQVSVDGAAPKSIFMWCAEEKDIEVEITQDIDDFDQIVNATEAEGKGGES